MTEGGLPPAGWYQDPHDARVTEQRWWDGSQWTEHTHSYAPSSPTATTGAAPTDQATSARSIPRFGARKAALELQEQLSVAQTSLTELGGLDHASVQQAIVRKRDELAGLQAEEAALRATLAGLQQGIVATEDTRILQEVGVYEYRHPLSDAAAYQVRLKEIQGSIKEMAKVNGGAVTGATDWTVNGSLKEGRKMVSETGKLMLRAYNAEADNLVRGLKPYKLDAAISRLEKSRATIAKLGRTMAIVVSDQYHGLRIEELKLTADFLSRKEEEKERDRAERERLREERKVQQEIERERQRLEKEQSHYLNALAKIREQGDAEAAARLEEQLDEIEKAIADVDYRAANMRAGYVYVISNVGSFGNDVVKVGMTRRIDPRDRVRELGDASVPFRYDVHALFFSKDAVALEQELHRRLTDRRINTVNLRREFFRATPVEVREHMLELAGDVLEFTEEPEALEWRQSSNSAVGDHGL